jgi:protein SCO1/2
LHGLVLNVDARRNVAVVRHDAFGRMPSMTMSFVLSHADSTALVAGEWIDAEANTSSEPWTLHDVHAAAAVDVNASNAAATRSARLIEVGDRIPATAFLDERSRPFTFTQLRGQTVVLAFIYTRCADARMCPLISAKFHALQGLLPRRFHLVEVTLDPSFDRPDVLARYGRVFGADPSRWTLATGDPNVLQQFAAQFGITPFPDPRVGLIHSERTAIIDPNGTVRQLVDDASWSPGEIVAAARAASRMSSNPFERFDLWLSSEAVALCGNEAAGASGILDLLVVLAIFGFFGWVLYALARRLFIADA